MVEHELERLPDNSTLAVELDGLAILVCNAGGTHYAVGNNCTHQDTPLEKGRLRNGYISCPLHGVRFSLATGEPMGGELTKKSLPTYRVIENDNSIKICIN